MFLFVFAFFLVISVCTVTTFLTLKYLKVAEENKKLESFITNVINSIKAVRYGNLNTRIIDGYNEITNDLSKTLNHTFESINDRENMIREYIEKDKENNKLKTDFIATLTHDLKVPIIAQDNTFELLLNNKFGELTQIQYEAIKNMKISNVDLKHLVETLLETFKMENAKTRVNISDNVNIADLINDCISQMQSIFILHEKKINFVNKLDNFEADVDQFLIKRVLQNLILNALLHSVDSDTVDVILDKADKNCNSFKISVRDYGVGIDKNEVKKIFNKYYMASDKFIHSGVGLGLYISNKIIKLHNGKIDVTSKKDKGSVFTIVLNRKN